MIRFDELGGVIAYWSHSIVLFFCCDFLLPNFFRDTVLVFDTLLVHFHGFKILMWIFGFRIKYLTHCLFYCLFMLFDRWLMFCSKLVVQLGSSRISMQKMHFANSRFGSKNGLRLNWILIMNDTLVCCKSWLGLQFMLQHKNYGIESLCYLIVIELSSFCKNRYPVTVFSWIGNYQRWEWDTLDKASLFCFYKNWTFVRNCSNKVFLHTVLIKDQKQAIKMYGCFNFDSVSNMLSSHRDL